MFFVVMIIIIILIAGYFFLREKNKNNYSENFKLDAKQTKTLKNFSTLVFSMLAQHGKGLNQSEISSNLNLPSLITAEKLMEMEQAGEITRKWANDDYTFVVNKK